MSLTKEERLAAAEVADRWPAGNGHSWALGCPNNYALTQIVNGDIPLEKC